MSALPSTGSMRALLRMEGAAVALVMVLAAWRLAPPWELVVAVLVAPDLGFAGYLRGPRTGAAVYNAAHSYVGPAALAALAVSWPSATLLAVAILWALHIGIDRALGYGLKHRTGFRDTHLGRIGGPGA